MLDEKGQRQTQAIERAEASASSSHGLLRTRLGSIFHDPKFLFSIPIVAILLVGWLLNYWQIVGLKSDFPFFDLSGPVPEIVQIEPNAVLAGETVTLKVRRLRKLPPDISSVQIGPVSVRDLIWNRGHAAITLTVPEGLLPSTYPVYLTVDKQQSRERVELRIKLLPDEVEEEVASKRKLLVLVARLSSDTGNDLLQTDLIEQLRHLSNQEDALRDRTVFAAWQKEITDAFTERQLKNISARTRASMIVYGRRGSDTNFYPKVFVTQSGDKIPAHLVTRPLSPSNIQNLTIPRDHRFELAAESVAEPIRLLRFLNGWSHSLSGDYAAATSIFEEMLSANDLGSLEEVSVLRAAGEASIHFGTQILEQPFRTDEDHRRGGDLLTAGLRHLEKAVSLLEHVEGRRIEAGRLLTYVALAHDSMPFMPIAVKHSRAIEKLDSALEFLDCDGATESEQRDACILAYANLSTSYEWLASTKWNRRESDELLEVSIKASRKALELLSIKEDTLSAQDPGAMIEQEYIRQSRIWIENGLAIDFGHYYVGDRDANLEHSIQESTRALEHFLARAEKDIGRIALTYNHIGTSYSNLERGDRNAHLESAQEAFRQGLTYVSETVFPEFHEMLRNNLEVLADSKRRGGVLPDWELLKRKERVFWDQLGNEEFLGAQTTALEILNWSWRRFQAPSRYAARAHYALGLIAETAGNQWQLALAHYSSARVILSKYSEYDEEWSGFLRDVDRKLIELWRTREHRSPNEVRGALIALQSGYAAYTANLNLALQLMKKDPASALVALNDALGIYPLSPIALAERSTVRLTLGKIESGFQDLWNALEIYPDDPITRFNRADKFAGAGKWEQAVADLDVAIAVGVDDPDYYYLRAICLEKLGRADDARRDYQIVIAKSAEGEVLRKSREALERLP